MVDAFDAAPSKQGARGANGVGLIRPMEAIAEYVDAAGVKMAILAVPGQAAQAVANQLVAAGIQAILNFAPVILQVPDQVVVNNVDLALELENLSYFIR